MIKIFLVEDEVVIRNAIKSSIDWEKEGYEFVGEAGDGELAYPKIMKEKPDILITDIRMPFMDGLELSKIVKKELPEIKILILSGFNDFEYAKEAIRIGVTDYLLKPISSAKLLEALAGVAKEIEKEQEEKVLREHYQNEMRENVEQEKFVFFTKLITGQVGMSEAIEYGKQYEMNLSAQAYTILLFKVAMNLKQYESEEEAENVFAQIDRVEQNVEQIYSFWRGAEGWAFLILGEDESDIQQRCEHLKEYLEELMNAYPKVEYFGGLGTIVSRSRMLPESYQDANIVFSNRFACESRQIMDMATWRERQEKGKLDAQNLDIMGKNREMIDHFLTNGTQEEIDSFLDVYFQENPKENLRSEIMRQYITIDSYITANAFMEKIGVEEPNRQEEGKKLEESLQKIVSAAGVRNYMKEMIRRVLEQRDMVSGQRYSDIMKIAKKYIEEQYMAESISLNTVSAKVNMSPSYFSAVFSREVGKTFVEYLTETRMSKAKELLMCSPMKTSEIGFEVGYKDPHYFSYIFKKTQGCSPKEYKQRVKREE